MSLIQANLKKVLLRVDATQQVALGHLKRCISLAQKLTEKGTTASFLITPDEYARGFLSEMGFMHTDLGGATNSKNDYEETVRLAHTMGSEAIIIDSYEVDNLYRQKLIDQGFFVVSITDTCHMDIVSHVIINSNLHAEKLRVDLPQETVTLCGITFLVLPKEFWDIPQKSRYSPVKINDILITMGGIDHYDLTTKIMGMLDKFDLDFTITAIIGPYYTNVDSIKSQASRIKKKVHLVNSPAGLFPYIERCALAFSAGGQTLYELAALGRPTVGITLWKNQEINVTELAKIGAIKGVVYSQGSDFDTTLFECTKQLITDPSQRKKMSEIASFLVDGRGADRVASLLLTIYSEWMTKKSLQRGSRV